MKMLCSDLNMYRAPQLHNVQSHFFFTFASQLVLYENEKNKNITSTNNDRESPLKTRALHTQNKPARLHRDTA